MRSRRRRHGWFVLSLVAALLAAWPLKRSARAEPKVRTIPIIFHVAAANLYSRAPEAFLADQVSHANDTFAPLAIAFRDAGREPLSPGATVLETRTQRDALLTLAKPGAVHCVIVTKLMDVDEPGRERRGVHWHPAKSDRPHIVIVSTLAGAYVLAHELAHYFGNPAHSEVAGNVLSYVWGAEAPVFTDGQRARVERAVGRMRREGEL